MNADRLRIVAKLLRMSVLDRTKPKIGFNLATFKSETNNSTFSARNDRTTHDCRTIACIAGWTVAAFDGMGKFNSEQNPGNFSDRAAVLLDLTPEQANRLFCPGLPFGRIKSDITPTEAAQALEFLARTGDISHNWANIVTI